MDNATPGRFKASDHRNVSRRHTTSYGPNQRVLPRPLSVSRNAAFKIRTPARGSYRVYGWWPSDRDYNARTVFRIKTTGGWTRRTVNQRINGGRWIYLGTYNLAENDSYRVEVSSKSPGRGRIVADAVKVMRS